jgi:hypothetical protein
VPANAGRTKGDVNGQTHNDQSGGLSGRRSADAVQKLDALGYTNIYDLGGILSWPYEIEGDFEGHF